MNDKDKEKEEETKEDQPEDEKEESKDEGESKEADKTDKASDDKDDEVEKSPSTDAQDNSSEDEPEEEIEVPDEYKDIVEKVEKMTVMELNALVKVLEKKFGVSAQAVAAQGASSDEAEEEKDSFTVELKSAGDSKIGVIKAVKAGLGLGLKEAKDLVEDAPAVLKEGVKKEEAEEMKKNIEEAGGEVELK